MLNKEILDEIESKILALNKGEEFQFGSFFKSVDIKGKLDKFNYAMALISRLKGKIGISKKYTSAIIEVPYLATFRRR